MKCDNVKMESSKNIDNKDISKYDYDNRERGRNVKSFLNENGTLISKR